MIISSLWRAGLCARLGGAALFAVVVLGSACGEPNREACAAYTEHLNSLECRADDVSVDDACPEGAFDGGDAADCVEYFDCLTTAATCDGDTFVNDISACTSCSIPE
jgi:hypothetical protein